MTCGRIEQLRSQVGMSRDEWAGLIGHFTAEGMTRFRTLTIRNKVEKATIQDMHYAMAAFTQGAPEIVLFRIRSVHGRISRC